MVNTSLIHLELRESRGDKLGVNSVCRPTCCSQQGHLKKKSMERTTLLSRTYSKQSHSLLSCQIKRIRTVLFRTTTSSATTMNRSPTFASVATVLIAVAVFLLVAPSGCDAHPTKYRMPSNFSLATDGLPPFLSYHVHVLFWPSNSTSVAEALSLKKEFETEFGLLNEKPCEGLLHQGRMCMYDATDGPDGPFLTAEWAVFILPEHFPKVVPWFMQRRGRHDLLVHPNSGFETADHILWALWGGTPWEIDTSIFHS